MNLFTYGTLSIAAVMQRICGKQFESEVATLEGYGRYVLDSRIYPGIKREEGNHVVGKLQFDVDAASFDQLDFFEGDPYQRTSVRVTSASGEVFEASTYVVPPDMAYELSDHLWNEDYFVANYLEAYLAGKPVWD